MKMHELRREVLLLLSFLFLYREASADVSAMPMQYLSRAELARIAGYGEEKLSSVLVAGTVLCDACLDGDDEYLTSYVHGVNVAVICKTEDGDRKISSVLGATDAYGDFIVDLPSHLHGNPNLESSCIVRVLRAPQNSLCHGVKSRSKTMKLSSVGNGIRVYTTGVMRLEHQARFSPCMKKKYEGESMW